MIGTICNTVITTFLSFVAYGFIMAGLAAVTERWLPFAPPVSVPPTAYVVTLALLFFLTRFKAKACSLPGRGVWTERIVAALCLGLAAVVMTLWTVTGWDF